MNDELVRVAEKVLMDWEAYNYLIDRWPGFGEGRKKVVWSSLHELEAVLSKLAREKYLEVH